MVSVHAQVEKRELERLQQDAQAELNEMHPLDISDRPGIEAAFVAHCPHCDHETFAIKGEREAVARLHMAIEDAAGGESRAGVVPSALGSAPRR